MRAFNRYYTNLIGVLDKGYLETQYSLTEARILFEISLGKKNASEIINAMRIDKSYLSRVLNKFEKNKLIIKSKSEKDSRASRICLTDKGMRDLNALNELADQQLDASLKKISATESKELPLHMNSIIEILDQKSAGQKSEQDIIRD